MKTTRSVLGRIVLYLLVVAATAHAEVVIFKDATLEAHIRQVLMIPDGPVMAEDMLAITELVNPGTGITDLTGLEYASNMELIQIPQGKFESLEPLAGLTKLKRVYFHYGALRDVSALSALSEIDDLSLFSNPDLDMTSLVGVRTKYLNVKRSISSIPDDWHADGILTLEMSGVGNGSDLLIPDTRFLSGNQTLRFLVVNADNLTLRDMPNLEGVYGSVGDSVVLEDLPELREFPHVDLNTRVLILRNLPSLTTLDMQSATGLENVTILGSFPSLTYASLGYGWNLVDILPLSELRQLTMEGVSPDFSVLRSFPKLEELTLDTCETDSYAGVENLVNLKRLILLGFYLQNKAPFPINLIEGLTGLESLFIDSIPVGETADDYRLGLSNKPFMKSVSIRGVAKASNTIPFPVEVLQGLPLLERFMIYSIPMTGDTDAFMTGFSNKDFLQVIRIMESDINTIGWLDGAGNTSMPALLEVEITSANLYPQFLTPEFETYLALIERGMVVSVRQTGFRENLQFSNLRTGTWLGDFYWGNYNYTLRHLEHGQCYLFGNARVLSDYIYLYDLALNGWIWTAKNYYPFIYSWGDKPGWLWYGGFSPDTLTRKFYSYQESSFFLVPPSDVPGI